MGIFSRKRRRQPSELPTPLPRQAAYSPGDLYRGLIIGFFLATSAPAVGLAVSAMLRPADSPVVARLAIAAGALMLLWLSYTTSVPAHAFLFRCDDGLRAVSVFRTRTVNLADVMAVSMARRWKQSVYVLKDRSGKRLVELQPDKASRRLLAILQAHHPHIDMEPAIDPPPLPITGYAER